MTMTIEQATTTLHFHCTSSHNAGWKEKREAWEVIRAHLSQPQPVAQGEAIGAIEACNRLDLLLDAYEHEVTGDTLHDKDWLVRDFINDTRVWEVFEALYATPTIPTGHRLVPEPWEDPTGFSVAAIRDEANNWTRRETGKQMMLNYADALEAGTLAAAPDAGGV